MNGNLSGLTQLFIVAAGVMICSLAGFGSPAICFSAPVTTETSAELTAQEKQSLVQQGVEQYMQGRHDQARENLEKARKVFPENYAVPYYLGLIYLDQGKRAAAINQWRQYVRMDPESDNALKIRKNLTILLREEARDSARLSVANEASLITSPAAEDTVAISTFNNLGSEDIKPLGKGMAALLIHDISQVPGLQVVERVRLQALLQEMNLGTSGLVTSETAPQVGKLLKAKHVTSGSLADLEKESLQIASALVDVDKATGIKNQEAQGELKDFYALEKKIACQIIQDLDRSCDEVPAAFHKIHTRSLPALIFFAAGLDFVDRNQYDQARASFQKAIEVDPSFDLAQEAFLDTPTSAMMSMSESQMISSASSSGPSSIASATAVARTSTTGTSITASGGGGTVGFPPTLAAIGGVALVGGVAAANDSDSGGAGGSSGGGISPTSTTDLTGDWQGTWIDTTNGDSGGATLILTQTNNAISGTVSVPGDQCLPAGNISGTVSGNQVNLTAQSNTEVVALTGTVGSTNTTIDGNWSFTSSALGCQADAGTFSVSKAVAP